MLGDTARKLLRVMYHFNNHYRRMPTLPEMSRLSGRTRAGILTGCRELALRGFIRWEPPQPVESAVILLAWEEPEPHIRSSGRGHWMG